uniref:Uncharacterized protein n=1 Tax=Heterorhabditis bacteriophora TaxID=37862 RepID=A0A1I7WKX0_HETBA
MNHLEGLTNHYRLKILFKKLFFDGISTCVKSESDNGLEYLEFPVSKTTSRIKESSIDPGLEINIFL